MFNLFVGFALFLIVFIAFWEDKKDARRTTIEIRLVKNLSTSMACHLVINLMSVFSWIIHGLSIDNPWIVHAWISIDIHGDPWVSMGIHGYPWISVDIQGYPLLSMDLMDIHGFPWIDDEY